MSRPCRLFTRSARIGAIAAASVLGLAIHPTAQAAETPAVVLFEFNGARSEPKFRVVNDGVMGGTSQSTVRTKAGVLTFAGNVSLENNGGFASMRTISRPDPTGASAKARQLVLRAKSSGTTFSVTIETQNGWYWSSFTTKSGEWTTVELPFSSFRPRTRFGEQVDGDPYSGAAMVRLGVIIANKKAESFRLDLDSISVG